MKAENVLAMGGGRGEEVSFWVVGSLGFVPAM